MDHGGHGFSDMFLGVELGHSFAQHHHVGDHGLSGLEHATFADAVAEALAISVALEHGGCNHLSGLSVGTYADAIAPSASGHEQSANTDWARPVTLPGTARDAKAITVLHWPHGACDPRNCVREEAAALGLKRHFPGAIDGNRQWDESLRGIRLIASRWPQDRSSLDAPLARKDLWDELTPISRERDRDRARLPNGWFQGAGGSTHIWREFYQNTPSLSRWLPWGRPNYETWRTYLMVSGITWSYRWRYEKTGEPIGDCETLISFAVISYPLFANGVWTYRWHDIREHRGFAERLARKVSTYLVGHPADPYARRSRRAQNLPNRAP